MSVKFVIFFIVLTCMTSGCVSPVSEILRICPGVDSAAEAVAILDARPSNAVSFKATGHCRLKYYADGKEKKEKFPVKLWVNPPSKIYMQGDVAFDPKGLVLGGNEQGFWLALKPREISSYWWGRWAQNDGSEVLLINPKIVLEAIGVTQIDRGDGWVLSRKGSFDVLTSEPQRNLVSRKIYISACDKEIRKIEYYNGDQMVAVVEMYHYREVSNGFVVPSVIRIIGGRKGEKRNYAEIRLGSVKQIEITGKQRRRMFTRPRPRGFEHVYRIVDGEVIEQGGY